MRKLIEGASKSWLVMKFTKLNYCQYLLSSQINYTMTNLAEHLSNISHDKINYYLKNDVVKLVFKEIILLALC